MLKKTLFCDRCGSDVSLNVNGAVARVFVLTGRLNTLADVEFNPDSSGRTEQIDLCVKCWDIFNGIKRKGVNKTFQSLLNTEANKPNNQ